MGSEPHTDPDRLLAQWQALRAAQPHIHLAQAAALLGVSEAALVAAHVGHGAVLLRAELPALLHGVQHWRTVMLVTPNALGVMIALLKVTHSQVQDDGQITVCGAQHHIDIDSARVRHCYLLQDQSVRGHSCMLCWFDAHGTGVGKLVLRSRIGRELALPQLLTQALTPATRHFVAEAAPAQQDARRSQSSPPPEEAAKPLRQALDDASRLESVVVTMTGAAVRARYRGPLGTPQATPNALHASAAGCKLHLRATVAPSIRALGAGGFHIQTHNGALTIAPDVPPRPAEDVCEQTP